jgi:penicillin-binding protein 2
MPETEHEHSGPHRPMIDTHRGLEPRIIAFYFLVAFLLLVLAAGLAYRQLLQTGQYAKSERQQNQRRILLPGPRGNIYDRNHKLLVGNRPRFTAVLYLDELQNEFRAEAIRIRANYKSSGASDVTWGQLEEIARVSVVQRYHDLANAILQRNQPLDTKELKAHFFRQLLVPYPLFEDLTPEEFARLLENLPVKSPLQLYVGNARTYPYGSAASHVLGYVQSEDNVSADGFAGDDLTTLKLRGTAGATGLEAKFDARLQGKSGGAIYRVDPTGYKVNPPLAQRMPQQGTDLITSLDIDLQLAAEDKINDLIGSAAALDVKTGEVLALVSKPDYDLNHFPHEKAAYVDAENRKALNDASYAGRYTPGSTFKILVSIAGLLSGKLDPDDTSVDCEYFTRIGNRNFGCDSGKEAHGRLKLAEAIADSCDIYFYHHGIEIGPETIVAQARRMHLEGRTGIELPSEVRSQLPDLAQSEPWTPGDTAEISIGQGHITETPLNMACFMASFARNEIWTQPTILHDPNRPAQHTEPIGLTPEQHEIIMRGLKEVLTDPHGTVHGALTTKFRNVPGMNIDGITVAGKTGTATMPDKTDAAWFVCLAPAEDPRIAIAVVIKGEVAGEEFGGAMNAFPIAMGMLNAYFKKGSTPGSPASAQTGGSPSPGSLSRVP